MAKSVNTCVLCKKPIQESMDYLYSGEGESRVCICRDCVEECERALEKKDLAEERKSIGKEATPSRIRASLDQYVIGQEDAKKQLSVAVYNHQKRLRDRTGRIRKSNILMAGPSGSGKTLLAKTLAKILDVPFVIVDATSYTESGYVGEDVESMLSRLYQAADYDLKKAERGIIYIDEIDKIGRKSENPSITRDVNGEGTQQAILKLIEGSVVNVQPQGGRRHPQAEYIQMDTSNILFICGGAFEGIGKKKRGNPMGFGNEKEEESEEGLTVEDFLKFGIIPELLGRLPVIIQLKELTEDEMVEVLTKPKDAIVKEYKELMKKDGIRLTFTKDALKRIVKKAMDRGTGARGLRAVMEEVMLDIMYEAPDREDITRITITKGVVDGTENPLMKEAV